MYKNCASARLGKWLCVWEVMLDCALASVHYISQGIYCIISWNIKLNTIFFFLAYWTQIKFARSAASHIHRVVPSLLSLFQSGDCLIVNFENPFLRNHPYNKKRGEKEVRKVFIFTKRKQNATYTIINSDVVAALMSKYCEKNFIIFGVST